MIKREIVIIISFLMLSIVTIQPALYGDPIKLFDYRPDNENEKFEKHSHIQDMLDSLKSKVYNHNNPTEEFYNLANDAQVQQTLEIIAGKEALKTTNILFSNIHPMLKKLNVAKYGLNIYKTPRVDEIREFTFLIKAILSYEIDSIEDIYRITELSENPDQLEFIKDMYIQYGSSDEFMELKPLAETLEIDLATLAILVFLIFGSWAYIYAGLAVCYANFAFYYTIGMWIIESILFGLVLKSTMALIVGNNGTHLFDYIADWIIERFYLPSVYHEFIEHFISNVCSLIFIASSLAATVAPFFLIENCTLWKFSLGGTAWFFLPVALSMLTYLVLYFLGIDNDSPSVNEDLLDSPFFKQYKIDIISPP